MWVRGMRVFCVLERFGRVWGSDFVLCVGQFGACLEIMSVLLFVGQFGAGLGD